MLRTCLRRPLRGLALVAASIVVAGVLSVRFRLHGPLRWVRRFNKYGLNRLTSLLAGRPGSPFVLVSHLGRRSGRMFRTPVMAAGSGDSLYIALTYGPKTDWCRNVREAGGGRMLRDGSDFEISAPEIVDASVALPAFPPIVRVAARVIGIRQFLKVRVGERAT